MIKQVVESNEKNSIKWKKRAKKEWEKAGRKMTIQRVCVLVLVVFVFTRARKRAG